MLSTLSVLFPQDAVTCVDDEFCFCWDVMMPGIYIFMGIMLYMAFNHILFNNVDISCKILYRTYKACLMAAVIPIFFYIHGLLYIYISLNS